MMGSDKERFTVAIVLMLSFLFYSFSLYVSLPVKKNIVIGESNKGKMLWQQYNCTACHQIYGLGGFLGPDLTNEYSLKGPTFINAYLKTGTTVMPNFHLTDKEIGALTDYLQNVDASGKADPRTFSIQPYGSITQ